MKMCLVKPTNTWGSLSDRLVKQLLGDALEPPNEAGRGVYHRILFPGGGGISRQDEVEARVGLVGSAARWDLLGSEMPPQKSSLS